MVINISSALLGKVFVFLMSGYMGFYCIGFVLGIRNPYRISLTL